MDQEMLSSAAVAQAPVAENNRAAPPIETILTVTGGYCVSRALHVIADAGIADAIGSERVELAEVARQTNCNADALGRLLRLLSAHGIFDCDGSSVRHNDASNLLRSDHPQSARALARMFGVEVFWASFLELGHSLRTGESATARRFPEGLWEWLGQRPEASAIFDQAMTAKAHAQVAGVVDAYDFSQFRTIADIGGGRGHLLQAILAKWPGARGILFDLPRVIEQAGPIGSDRLELRAGDFFSDELPSCDAYILMEVIHDWADPQARDILSAVARSAASGARLLLVEQLMLESAEPNWVQMLDIHMLALFSARQRSREEYEKLMVETGFEPVRAIDTFSGASVLEAVKS